jgi:hypothetical protein
MTRHGYPDYISFTDAAALIVRRGLAGSMTPRGLRYMATARSSKKTPKEQRWPFGDEADQRPYLIAGKTRMMHTETLIRHLTEHPPTGRGPNRGERTPREPEE